MSLLGGAQLGCSAFLIVRLLSVSGRDRDMSSIIGSIASFFQFYIDQHPFPTILVIGAVLHLIWYCLVVDRRPLLYGGRGGLKDYLLAHCPVLSQSYRPTIWAWHYHGTTIIRALFQQCMPVEFDRYHNNHRVLHCRFFLHCSF